MTASRCALLAAFAALAATGSLVHAATLTVEVLDAAGQPVTDATVHAEPASGPLASKTAKTVDIEQKGRKFLPQVTIIQTGTRISFPNNDTVRHHVYSLSPAKVFDLKLYAGEPPNPVMFDKPGTVVIGCNIHDKMAAYIQVVATPFFGKTDAAGQVRLEGMAPGKYLLKAWHYGMPAGAAPAEQAMSVTDDGKAQFTLNMKAR